MMKKYFLKMIKPNSEPVNEQTEHHFSDQASQKKWMILSEKICPHIITALFLFGFAFYVKHENTVMTMQYSHLSLAREAELLSTLNEIDSHVEQIKTGDAD